MTIPIPPLDRFVTRIDFFAPNGCWEWLGYAQPKRYGTFMDGDQRTVNAHRFAYLEAVEPIPAGMHLDHLCRNTICVNPDHLEVVTPAENLRRSTAIARASEVRSAKAANGCPANHPWTEDNVYIRPKDGWRECRTCRRERDAQRRRAA